MRTIIFNNNSLLILLTILTFISCTENNDVIDQGGIVVDMIDIPDSRFETILIEQGIDSDNTLNHKISKEDAENITKLDLNLTSNFGEIEDLTGIEGFSNLTFLSAANQKIETIDLSFNTKLDSLYIHGNYLKEVDLSKNINLIDIDIESNELHTINGLSMATNLKKLNASWNNLKNFNLDNSSVEVLYISHNLLKNLNISDAPNLTNILAIINQMNTLDISNNSKLETLLISGNQIQEMDLQNNVSLTHFYASSNKFINLDVSFNQSLIDLRIDRNPTLTCIQKGIGQNISNVSLSDYQNMSINCD
jgi:hypothetical protein